MDKKIYTELPKEGFEECILCGEKTKGTAFCRDCWKLYTKEELLEFLNDKNDQQENEKKCILCGAESGNYLFCKKCYSQYKGKTLLLQIKVANDQEIKILNDSYEGIYTCKDGHVVKSKSEREIDNYLFDHKITHAYEKALPIDENEENDLHPDFYLKDFLGEGKDVYIEHWGYNEDNTKYQKEKKYKLKKYEELKITLICTNEEKDAKDIEVALNRKLNKKLIKENEINFN